MAPVQLSLFQSSQPAGRLSEGARAQPEAPRSEGRAVALPDPPAPVVAVAVVETRSGVLVPHAPSRAEEATRRPVSARAEV